MWLRRESRTFVSRFSLIHRAIQRTPRPRDRNERRNTHSLHVWALRAFRCGLPESVVLNYDELAAVVSRLAAEFPEAVITMQPLQGTRDDSDQLIVERVLHDGRRIARIPASAGDDGLRAFYWSHLPLQPDPAQSHYQHPHGEGHFYGDAAYIRAFLRKFIFELVDWRMIRHSRDSDDLGPARAIPQTVQRASGTSRCDGRNGSRIPGPSHRNVVLAPAEGMLILDVVSDVIAQVEVLDRDDIREKLLLLLP